MQRRLYTYYRVYLGINFIFIAYSFELLQKGVQMKNDVDTSIFFDDNERFADLINVQGRLSENRIHAEDLESYDTRLSYYLGMRFKKKGSSKIRDSIRRVIFGMNFIITEFEFQEEIDYSYPLRDMGYIFGEYEQQARKVRKIVRKKKDGLTVGELLYGFKKNSKLRPTIIFLLYFGEEEWDGPTCIHDMLDFTDIPENMKQFVQNHQINLIDIHRMTDEELELFHTDVGKVFRLIKYAENREKIVDIITNDDYYKNMDSDAYEMALNYVATNKKLLETEKYENELGGYDMKKAFDQIREYERKEGIKEGENLERIRLLVDLVNDKVINLAEAAKRMNVTEEEFMEIMQKRVNEKL